MKPAFLQRFGDPGYFTHRKPNFERHAKIFCRMIFKNACLENVTELLIDPDYSDDDGDLTVERVFVKIGESYFQTIYLQ